MPSVPTAADAPVPSSERQATACWLITAVLVSFPTFIQLGLWASYLAGRAGISWALPAGLLTALLLGDQLGRRTNLGTRERLTAIGLGLGIIAVSTALSAWYFDLSWDGQWYHQLAIYKMALDWNPLFDPMVAHFHDVIWYYAKGPWSVAAAFCATTGNAEMGKCLNWITWAAMGLAVFAAGLDWNLTRWRAAMIALVVALNPVVMSEITTFMVDGIMMSILTVVIAAMLGTFRQPRLLVLAVGVMASIACINAKLNGLVYLCIVFAAGGLWCLFFRRDWLLRYAGLILLTLVVGMAVVGYNPYVTNTIYKSNPLYPAIGTDRLKYANDRSETPKNIVDRNRFVRLGYSIFGRPGNQPYVREEGKDARLMWPFTATPADMAYYRFHETRVSGFGPFFSGAFLFSIALGIWLLCRAGTSRLAMILIALTIAGSVLISPQLWWPRFGPQLWLLPIVPVIFAFAKPTSRGTLAAAWGLAALLAVNALTVAAIHLTWETRASYTLRQQLTDLHQSGRTIRINFLNFELATQQRLKLWGVPYQQVDRKQKIINGTALKSVVDGYPGEITYLILPPEPAGASAP